MFAERYGHGVILEHFVRLGRVRLSFENRTLRSFGFVNSGESELLFRLSSLFLNRRTFFPVWFDSNTLAKSGAPENVWWLGERFTFLLYLLVY